MKTPRSVPFPQREQFKKELDRKEKEGVIRLRLPEEAEECEWWFLIFGMPKKQNRSVYRSITVSNNIFFPERARNHRKFNIN